jgi:type II secretory pathway component GspD/PulD (secretin)
MTNNTSFPGWKYFFTVLFGLFVSGFGCGPLQAADPKPIVIQELTEAVEKRMQRSITLDVRDMNIVDVIKFLAMKGDFNVVISPSVEGRVTVFLNNVSIKDALDIVIIANNLAYSLQGNIIQVNTSAEYEAMYGKRFGDQTRVEIIRLQYSRPSYVLAALDNIKSNVGKIIIDEDTGSVVMIDTPSALEKMRIAIQEIEQPLEAVVYNLQYASADVVAEKLRARIDAKAVGSITPDSRANKLIVRVFPGRQDEIMNVIRELDSKTKEVMIDAKILQIVMKPEYDVGIDWQLDFKKSSNSDLRKVNFKNFAMGSQNSSLAASDNLAGNFGQIAFGDFSVDQFQLTLRSLEKVSDTKILSNPQILITNNEEARIHVGDTVPYIISTTSGTGDNAITSEDVRFVDVGLKLNVRPTINDDGFVTMRLRPEISSVIATITSQGGGIPQVNKTEVETTVMVKDGHTIVMGGLKKNDKVHTKHGVPFLMGLPVVGKAFSRTADNFNQTEIAIFITPKIVSGHDEYEKLRGTIKPFKKYSTDG